MDSDDFSSTDDGKRKKIREANVFANSKKVSRSPVKQKKSDEKLDLLIEMVKKLKVEQMKTNQEQGETKEVIKEMREENKILRQENAQIKEEYDNIRGKVELLEIKIEWLEKEIRKNNIVLKGLNMQNEDNEKLDKDMRELLVKEIGVETQIEKGQKVYLVELGKYKDKENVMKNKYKLRNKSERIYIDLTKKEQEKGRQIRKRAMEENNKGKTVKVGYNKVIIDGEEWRWNRDKEILVLSKSKNE